MKRKMQQKMRYESNRGERVKPTYDTGEHKNRSRKSRCGAGEVIRYTEDSQDVDGRIGRGRIVSWMSFSRKVMEGRDPGINEIIHGLCRDLS